MQNPSPIPLSPDTLILGNAISFGYRRRKVIQDLSFAVEARGLTIITGMNGGGKTTLLKLMAGALAPKSGTITRAWPDYRQRQAYQPAFNLLDTGLTLEAHKRQLATIQGFSVDQFEKAYRGLSTLAEPNQRLKTLSTGTLRKLNLAAVLSLQDRDLVFIDEMDELLDEDSLPRLADLLVRQIQEGKTIVTTLQHSYWLEGIACPVNRIAVTQTQPAHV